MKTNLFLNSERGLRDGWWIVLFFLMLTLLLVPTILTAQQSNMDVSISMQTVLIILVSIVCQWLRREPVTKLFGQFNRRWLKELGLGGLLGSTLMLIPVLTLAAFGWVRWTWNPTGVTALSSSLLLFAGVALAEELLFRGFVFQRLMSGLGPWAAQLVTAAFFLLTHLNNPGMAGSVRVLASINIFLASILFGLAFIRTRSLAMPLGIHWMANCVQGGLLGFGVSGAVQVGVLKPVFHAALAWITGSSFGLEASIFGLISLIVMLLVLNKYVTQEGPDASSA
jgi:membrane protease YdiL (CAAX protease family)